MYVCMYMYDYVHKVAIIILYTVHIAYNMYCLYRLTYVFEIILCTSTSTMRMYTYMYVQHIIVHMYVRTLLNLFLVAIVGCPHGEGGGGILELVHLGEVGEEGGLPLLLEPHQHQLQTRVRLSTGRERTANINYTHSYTSTHVYTFIQ